MKLWFIYPRFEDSCTTACFWVLAAGLVSAHRLLRVSESVVQQLCIAVSPIHGTPQMRPLLRLAASLPVLPQGREARGISDFVPSLCSATGGLLSLPGSSAAAHLSCCCMSSLSADFASAASMLVSVMAAQHILLLEMTGPFPPNSERDMSMYGAHTWSVHVLPRSA